MTTLCKPCRFTVLSLRNLNFPSSSSRRQFHASRSNRLLAEAIQLSHDTFQAIHTYSGLSWGLSIPLTAALVRLSWVPFQILVYRNQHRQQMYSPLIVGWRKALQLQAIIKFPQGDQTAAAKAEQWVRTQLKEKDRLYKSKYGVRPRWQDILLQLSFLPVWIVNADVIRRMSGNEKAILGTFKTGTEGLDSTNLIATEINFSQEGLLWFPDLTLADPLWILPVAFGLLQFANVWEAGGKNLDYMRKQLVWTQNTNLRIVRKFMISLTEVMLASCLVFPWMLIQSQASAAIALYLVGSATTQLIQRPIVKHLMGVKRGIEEAKPRYPQMKRGKGSK